MWSFQPLAKKWRYAQNYLSHPSKKGAVSTTNPSYRIHFWLHRSKKRAVEDVKDSERSIPQLHQDKDSGRSMMKAMMMLRLTWHQFYRQSHGEEVDTTRHRFPQCMSHKWRFTPWMQYWWLHRWKWCLHAIAPEFAPKCAPEKARKHQKSDWCQFICGTDVSTRCNNSNGGRWLLIVLVQRALSLVGA